MSDIPVLAIQPGSTPFMRLVSISYGKNALIANLRVHVSNERGVKSEATLSLPPDGKSLAEPTGLAEYAPYVIDRIDMAWQQVEFTNGFILKVPHMEVPVGATDFSAVSVVADLPSFTEGGKPAQVDPAPEPPAAADSLEAFSALPQKFIGRVNVVGDCYCFGVVVERRPPNYKSIPV